MTDNGMIEVFRGDEQGGFSPRYFLSFSFVFLCFYSFVFSGFIRGQRPFIVSSFCHSRNLQSGIQRLLNTYGPRLKDCRGDEQGVIEPFRGRLKTA